MEKHKSGATGGAPTSTTEHQGTSVLYITHYFTLGRANYRLAVLETSEQPGPSDLADLNATTVPPGEEVWFVDSQLPVDQDECIVWKWALTDLGTAKEKSSAETNLQAETIRVLDSAWDGGQVIVHSRDSSLTESIEPVALIGIVGKDEELSEPEEEVIIESAKAVVQAVIQAAFGKITIAEEDILARTRGKSPSITLEEMADKQAFATDVAKRVVNLAQKQITLDEQERRKNQGDTADTKQLETRRTSIKNFEDLVGDEDITKQAVHLAKLEMVTVSLGSDSDGGKKGGGSKAKGKAKKGKKQNATLNEMVGRSLFAAGIAKNVIKLAQMQVYSSEIGISLVQDTTSKESDEGVSPQEESVISDILNGIRTLKRRKQVKVAFDTSWDKNGNVAPLSEDREGKSSKEERTILVPTVDNRYMKSRGLDLTEQSVELKFRPSYKDLTPESDYSGDYDSAPMEIETKAYETSRRKSLVDEIPDSVQYQIYRRMSQQDPTFAATLREMRESASDTDSDNKDEIDRIIDLLPHVDLRTIHKKYLHQQDQVVPTMRPVHSHTLRLDGTYNEEEEMETGDVSLDEEKADEISRLVYNLCRRYSLHEVENLQLYKRMSIIPGASPLSIEITPDMACYTAHPDSGEDEFARPEQEESSISMTLDPTPTVTLPSQYIETRFGDSENRYRKFLLEAEPGHLAAEMGLAVPGEIEYKAVDPGSGEVTVLSQKTETLEFQLESAMADAEGDRKIKYSVIDAGTGDETVKPDQQTETIEFQLESALADAEGDTLNRKIEYSAIEAGSDDEIMKPNQRTETLEFQLESALADAEGDTLNRKIKYSAIDPGYGSETMKPNQQMETVSYGLEGAQVVPEGDTLSLDYKEEYPSIYQGTGDETMKPDEPIETVPYVCEGAQDISDGDMLKQQEQYRTVEPDIGVDIGQDQTDILGDTLTQQVPEQSQGGHEPSPARSEDDFVFVNGKGTQENADQQVPTGDSPSGSSGDADFVMVSDAEESADQQKTETFPSQGLSDEQMTAKPQVELAEIVLQEASPMELLVVDEKSLNMPEAADGNQEIPLQGASLEQMSVAKPVTELIESDSELPYPVLDQADKKLVSPDADQNSSIDEAITTDVAEGDGMHEFADVDEFMEVGENLPLSSESSIEFEFEDAVDSDFDGKVVIDNEGPVEQTVSGVVSQLPQEFIEAEMDLLEQHIKSTSPAATIETQRPEVDTIELTPQEERAGEDVGPPRKKQATDDLREHSPEAEQETERGLHQVQTAKSEEIIGVSIQNTVELISPELTQGIEDGKSRERLITDLDGDTANVDNMTKDLDTETNIQEQSPAVDVVALPLDNTLELGSTEMTRTVEEGSAIEAKQLKITDLDVDAADEVRLTTDRDEGSDVLEQSPADPILGTAPVESTIELAPFGIKQALDEDGRFQDKLVTDLDADISEDGDIDDGRIFRTDLDEALTIQEQSPRAKEDVNPNILTSIQIIPPEPDDASQLFRPLGDTKKMKLVTNLDDDEDDDADVIGILDPGLSKSTETLTTDLDADSSDDDYALPTEDAILSSQDAGNEQNIIRSLEVHTFTSEEAVCGPDAVGTVLEVRTSTTDPVSEEQKSEKTVRIPEAEVVTVATTTTVTEATSASITYEGENFPEASNSVVEIPFLEEDQGVIDLIEQSAAMQQESCEPVLSDESLSPDLVSQCPFTDAITPNPFATPLTTVFFRTHYRSRCENECVAVVWDSEDSKETQPCQSCMGEEIPTKSGFWYMFSRLPTGSRIKWKLVLFNTETGSLIGCEERSKRILLVPNVYTLIDALWAFGDTEIDVHDCERQLESIPFSYDLRRSSDTDEDWPIKLESIPEEKDDNELNVERQDSSVNYESIEAYSESLEEDIMSDATFLAEQLSQFVPSASGRLEEVEEEIDLTENQVTKSTPLALDDGEQIDRTSEPTEGLSQIPSDTITTAIASDGALVPTMTDVFFRTHYLVHSDDEYVAVIGVSEYLGNWKVHTSIGEELPKGSGFWYVYCKLPTGLKINWKLIVFDRRQGHFLRFEERPNRQLLIPSKPIMIDVLWAYYGEFPIKIHPDENDLESIPFSFDADVPEAYRDRRTALFGKALNFPPIALKYDSMRVAQPDEIVQENLVALAKEVLSESDNVVREESTGGNQGEEVVRPTRRVSRIHKAPFEIQLALVPYMTDVFIRTHYLVHSNDEYVAVIGDSDFLGSWKIHTSFGEELPKGSGFWYVYCKLPAGLGINWKLIVFNRREGRFLRFEERPNRSLVVPSHPIMIDALWAYGQTPIEVNPDETELECIPFSYPVDIPEAYRNRRAEFASNATKLQAIALKYENLKVLIDAGPIPENLAALAKEVLSDGSNKENVEGTSQPEKENKSVRERRVSIVHDITLGFDRQIDTITEPSDTGTEASETSATDQANQQEIELPETKAYSESILSFISQTLEDGIMADAEALMETLRQKPSNTVETPDDVEEQIEMTEQSMEQSIPSLLEDNKDFGEGLVQVASETDATPTDYGALVPFMTDVFFRTHHLVDSDNEYVAVIGDSEYLGNWKVHTRIGEELPKGSGFWYVYCRLPAGLKINWKLIVFDREQGRFLHFEERPNRKLIIPSHPIMVDVLWGCGQTSIEVHPDEIKLESIPFSYVVDVPKDYRNRREELFGNALNIPAIALKYESLRVAHEDEEVPAALAKEVLSDIAPMEEGPDAIQTTDEQVPVRPVTLVHEVPFEIQGALVPYMTDVFFRTHRLVDADDEHVSVIGETELLGDRKVHTSIGEELPKGSGFWYVYCKLPAGSKLQWKLIVFDPRKGRFLHFEDRPNRKLTIPCHPIMVDALWSYGQTPIDVRPDETELERIPFSYIVDVPDAYMNRRAAIFADALASPAIALKYESLRVTQDEEDIPENLAALAEEVLEDNEGEEVGADNSESLGEPVPDRRVSIAQDVPFEIQGALVPYMTDVFFRTHYLVHSDDEQIAVIGDSEYLGNWNVHTGIGEELPKGSGFWYVYCKLPAGLKINWKLIVFNRHQGLFLRYEERPNRKLTIPSHPIMVDALWAYGQTPINVHPDEKELESIPFSYLVDVPEAYRKRRHELYAEEEPNTAIALKYESLKLDHGDEEMSETLEALAKEVLSTEDVISPTEAATQEIIPSVISAVPERRVSLINQIPFRVEETTNPCDDDQAEECIVTAQDETKKSAIVITPDEVESCILSPPSTVVDPAANIITTQQRGEEETATRLDTVFEQGMVFETLGDEEVSAAVATEVFSDILPMEEGPDAIQTTNEQVPVRPITRVHEVPFESQGALVPYMTDVFFRTHRLVDADDEHVSVIGETELLGDRKVHTSIGEELPKGSGFWYVYCKLPAGSKLHWKLIVFNPRQGRFLHFEDRPNRKLTVPCHPIMVDALWSYGQTPIEVRPDETQLERIPFSYIVDVPDGYKNRRAAFFADALDSPAIALKYESLRVTHDEKDIPENLAALAEEVLEDDEREADGADNSEMLGEPVPDRRVSIAQDVPFEIQGALVPYMTDVFFRTHRLVDADDEHVAVIGETELLGDRKVHTSIGEELPKGSGFWYVYCKLPAGSKLHWKLIVFDPRQGRFLHFEDRPNRKLTVPCHPIMVDALWSYGQTPIDVRPDETELERIPFSYIVDVPDVYRNRRAALFADALDSPAIALKYESLRVTHDEEDIPANIAALADEVLEDDEGEGDGADTLEMLGEHVPDRRVSLAQDVPFEIQGALVPYMTDVFFRTHYLVHSDDEQIAVIGDSEYLGNWNVHTGIGEELPKGSGFWYVYCKLPAGLKINWKLIVFNRRQGLFLRFEERPNRKLTIPSHPIMVDALWAYGQTPINVHPVEKELESIPFSYLVDVPEAYRKRRHELYAQEEPNTAIALKYERLKLDHGDEEMSETLEALAKEVLSTEDVISPTEAATQEIIPSVISAVPERCVSLINQIPFRVEETTNPCDDEQAQESIIPVEDESEKFAVVITPEEVQPCIPSPPPTVVDPSSNIIITTQQRDEEVAATRLDTVPFEQGMAFETSGDVIQNALQTPDIGEQVGLEFQAAVSHEITTVEKSAVDYTNSDLTPQDPLKTIYIFRQEDVELEEPMTATESKQGHTVPTPKEYRVLEASAPGHQERMESFDDSSGSGLHVTIQPMEVSEEQRTCVSPTTERAIIYEGLGQIEQSTEIVTGITQITELQSAQTSEELISVDPESTERAGVLIIEGPQRKQSNTEPRPLAAVDLKQESYQAVEESMTMESAESQEAGVPFSVHSDAEQSVAMSETTLMTEEATEGMVSLSEMQTEVPEATIDSYHEVAMQDSALPTEGVQPYDADNVESLGDVPQVTLQTTEIEVVVGSEEAGPMESEHALNVPEEDAPVVERKVSITAPRPTMEIDLVCHEITEIEISQIGAPEIQDIGYDIEDTAGHIVALSEKSVGAENTVSLEPELTLNVEGAELATQVEERISVIAPRPLAEIDPVSHNVTEIETAHMETPEAQVIAYDTEPVEERVVALTERAIGMEEVVPYDADHVERLGDVPEVTLQTTEIQVVVGSEEADPMEPEHALNVPEEKAPVVERKVSITAPRPVMEIDLLSHEDQGTEAGELVKIESEMADYRREVFAEHTAALQEATVPTEGMSKDSQHVSDLEIPPAITIQVTEREAAVVMDSRPTEGVSKLLEEATMQITTVNEEPCVAIEGVDGRDRPLTEIMAVESDTQQEVTSDYTGELHTEEVTIHIQSTGEHVVILQEEVNIPEESSPAAEPVELQRSKEEIIIAPENTSLNVKNVTVVEKAPFIQVELTETAPESTIQVVTQQANTLKERPISQTELQLEFSEQSSTEEICVTPVGKARHEEMGDQQRTITTEITMPVETVHESNQIRMELSQAMMEVEGMEGQLTAITQKTIPEEDVAVDSPDLDSVALISDYATIEMQQAATKETAVVEKTILAENATGLPEDMKEGDIGQLNTIIRTYMSGLDADDRLGVTGDLPELGNWKTIKHFAVENPPGSGLWYIHLSLPRGVSFWWKLVQGSPDGLEIRKWEDHAERRYIVPTTGDSMIDVLWSSEEKVIALSDVTTEMTEIPFDYGEVRINTDRGLVGVTKVDDLTNGVQSNIDTLVPGFEYRLPDPKENINVNVKVDVKQPLPREDSRDYGSETSMQTAHESVEDFDDEETKKELGKDETTLDFDNDVTAEVRERELLWVLKSQSEIQVCIGPRRGRDGDAHVSSQLTQNFETNGRITNGVAGTVELSTGIRDLEPSSVERIAIERTSTRTWFRTHRFVGEGLGVGLTGSLPELGAWDPSAAVTGVEHPVGSGFWYIDSCIRVGERFQWKLAVIDQRTKVVKEEEDRDRREHCIPSLPVLIDTIWSGIDRVNLVEDVADESDLEKIPPLSKDGDYYPKTLKHIDEKLLKYHLDIDIARVSETQGTGDQEIDGEEVSQKLPYSEFSRGIHVSSSECDFETSRVGECGLVNDDAVVPTNGDRCQLNELSTEAASRFHAYCSFPATHKLSTRDRFPSHPVLEAPRAQCLILSVTTERLRDETVWTSMEVFFIDFEKYTGKTPPPTGYELNERKDLSHDEPYFVEYDRAKHNKSNGLQRGQPYSKDYNSRKPTPLHKYASDVDVRRENTCSTHSLPLSAGETHSSQSLQSLTVTFDVNGRFLSCSDTDNSEESVCFVSYEVHKMNLLNNLADNEKTSSCPLIYEIGDELGFAKNSAERGEGINVGDISIRSRNGEQVLNVKGAQVSASKHALSSSSDDVFYEGNPPSFSCEYSSSETSSATIELPEASEEVCFISYSDSEYTGSVGNISMEIGQEGLANNGFESADLSHEPQDSDSTLDGTVVPDCGVPTGRDTMDYSQEDTVFFITYASQSKEKDVKDAITKPLASGKEVKQTYNSTEELEGGEEVCFITYEEDLKNSISELQTNKDDVNKDENVGFRNNEEGLKNSGSKFQANEGNVNKEGEVSFVSYGDRRIEVSEDRKEQSSRDQGFGNKSSKGLKDETTEALTLLSGGILDGDYKRDITGTGGTEVYFISYDGQTNLKSNIVSSERNSDNGENAFTLTKGSDLQVGLQVESDNERLGLHDVGEGSRTQFDFASHESEKVSLQSEIDNTRVMSLSRSRSLILMGTRTLGSEKYGY